MPSNIRDSLNMRIKPEDRQLFDWAAQSMGKTRTDFILQAARKAAEEALLDRSLIHVSAQDYAHFIARLDATPSPNKTLKQTMQTIPPWDRQAGDA
jgi:uncharacterized protein (DUF1778 family)